MPDPELKAPFPAFGGKRKVAGGWIVMHGTPDDRVALHDYAGRLVVLTTIRAMADALDDEDLIDPRGWPVEVTLRKEGAPQ